MVRQKLQKSVSKKDKRIHKDSSARRIKFSKLAEKEDVKKKLWPKHCVFLLPIYYKLHTHLERGTTLWNYCKGLLEANNYFGIAPLCFYLKSKYYSMQDSREGHILL